MFPLKTNEEDYFDFGMFTKNITKRDYKALTFIYLFTAKNKNN